MMFRTRLLAVVLLSLTGPAIVLRAEELKLRETLNTPRGKAYSLAYSPDGKTLAVGTVDGKIYLWDRK